MSDVLNGKTREQVLAEWTAALRSGKYKQAKGKLRDGDCFCCLGVLCDLMEPAGWEANDETGGRWFGPTEDCDMEEIPLRLEAALDRPGDTYGSLSTKNDVGATFHEIADLIDRLTGSKTNG